MAGHPECLCVRIEKCAGLCVMLCRPVLDEVSSASYELTEAEYAANEVEDTWVQTLVAALAAYLGWLQPLLTPANYEQFTGLLLEKVCNRMPSCASELYIKRLVLSIRPSTIGSSSASARDLNSGCYTGKSGPQLYACSPALELIVGSKLAERVNPVSAGCPMKSCHALLVITM